MPYTSVPLVPKDPNGPLRVLVMGRISTAHQNLENIDASYRYAEEFLKQVYQGPLELKHLGEQGSGMRTDRLTILEAEEKIATGTWDLVITEDLARFYRNPRHQYAFVQDAVDHDTRVICIGDNLDTADENWEITMGAAALRHGLHIPDTRRRVRRTATHAFHQGGMVQKVRFGYRKLSKEEAESGQFGPKGLRLAKLPECTPTIHTMKEMVMVGATYEAVANWLLGEGIDPGSYVTSGQWSGKLVEDLLRDPILSGTRTFRDTLHQPIFKTGKHRRRKNPNGPETEYHPELAHLTPEEQQGLLAVMDARAAEHPQQSHGRDHVLFNRPRSQSLWPGQQMRCAACVVGLLYWGAKGQLKCQHAFGRGAKRCWNHVQVSAEEVRTRVLGWLLRQLDAPPQFREFLIEATWQEYVRVLRRSQQKERTREDQVRAYEEQAANLAKAIAAGGQLPSLLQQLQEVEQALANARQQKAQEENRQQTSVQFASREEIAAQLDEAILTLSRTSLAFADLLRRVFPRFVIQPVQALDSGLVRPRVKITLRLSALTEVKPNGPVDSVREGDQEVVLDLFDPPEQIRHLRACLEEKARNPKHSLKKIAAALGINYMTVKRAFDYARRMAREGLQEPYRELHAAPAGASRWKKRKSSS